MTPLAELAKDTFLAGLVAVNGLSAVLPELQRDAVHKHQWMDADSFTQHYAISTAAPGPNSIFLAFLGFHVGGVVGALVSILAFSMGPILMLCLLGAIKHPKAVAHLRLIRKGLVPTAVGFTLAGGFFASKAFQAIPIQVTITAAALGFLIWRPKTNPLFIVAACAAAGLIFLR